MVQRRRGSHVASALRSGLAGSIDTLTRKGPLRRIPDGALGALSVLAVLLVGSAAVMWWPTGAHDGFAISSAQAPSSALAATSTGGSTFDHIEDTRRCPVVVVDVAGAVTQPGVVELPEGSRVIAAVEAAGGPTEDAETSSVNLARVLVDGEQVYIPTSDEAASLAPAALASPVQAGGQKAAPSLIDINTASAAELETLTGIGPAIAQRIVDDREANGPFSSKEDLKRVRGIGDKKYAAIEDAITAS